MDAISVVRMDDMVQRGHDNDSDASCAADCVGTVPVLGPGPISSPSYFGSNSQAGSKGSGRGVRNPMSIRLRPSDLSRFHASTTSVPSTLAMWASMLVL